MTNAAKKIEVIHRRGNSTLTNEALIKDDICDVITGVLSKLLAYPEKTKVSWVSHEHTTVYEIETVQEDFGRLIGAKGKHISSLRILTLAMSAMCGFRAVLEIKNEEQFLNCK